MLFLLVGEFFFVFWFKGGGFGGVVCDGVDFFFGSFYGLFDLGGMEELGVCFVYCLEFWR